MLTREREWWVGESNEEGSGNEGAAMERGAMGAAAPDLC